VYLHTARRYGYSSKGQRVHGPVSGKKYPRTSLIAARIGQYFAESFLFQWTCNTEVFNAWVQQQLCLPLNDSHVIVMDNLSFHKGEETKNLIKKTGATLLFLPPHSPDLNPIEYYFAAIKNYPQIQ
jgi:putative transposase